MTKEHKELVEELNNPMTCQNTHCWRMRMKSAQAITELSAKVVELERDRERLDWYERYRKGDIPQTLDDCNTFYKNQQKKGVRYAIDEHMKTMSSQPK